MRTKLIAIFVVLLWLGATRPLWAQSSIAPYLGFNRGGDSVCSTAQNCDDKMLSLGTSLGTMQGLRGLEEDFRYGRDLFVSTPGGSRVFVLSGGALTARVTPHITALFAPQGNSLKFWRGAFRVVVSF